MDRNIQTNERESNKIDPRGPPECPPYTMYPMTDTSPCSPPPYTMNPPQPCSAQPSFFVVTDQPKMVVPYQPDVNDHLYCSIANLLCCNLLLGACALVFSVKTRSSIRFGYSAAAAGYSRTASSLNVVGFILGITCHLIWISVIIYWAVTHGEARKFLQWIQHQSVH